MTYCYFGLMNWNNGVRWIFLDRSSINFTKYFHLYLFGFILLTLSPFGVLSGNEEMYYGLANKFINPEWNGEYSSFIFSGNYRFISDTIIGLMVKYLGFEKTQIIGSLFASVIFALALWKLCTTLDLNNSYGLLSIIVFVLLGQSFIGREWIFEDFEAKIFAYVFVILGINQYLKENSMKMVVLLSIATYFHLLVGVQWLCLLVLASFVSNGNLVAAIKILGAFFLLCCPILFIAIEGFYGSNYIQDDAMPTPLYIYSYIRQYKMVLPFYSVPRFILQWLPGITIYIGILIGLWVTRGTQKDVKSKLLYDLIKVSTVMIFVFLLVSAMDSSGSFGKLYPYRFTSLLLLLTLFYACLKLQVSDLKSGANIGPVLLLTLFPFFAMSGAINSVKEIHNHREGRPAKVELYQFLLDNTTTTDIILIDPKIEEKLHDMERKLNRPTLVTFKYITSSKEGLAEWYKRREFKSQIISNSEKIETHYPYNFIITNEPSHVDELSPNHSRVFENGVYTVLRK